MKRSAVPSVFERIDATHLAFFGLSPLGFMKNISAWRKYFAVCVIVASLCWGIFGFDSTWEQLQPFVTYFSSVATNPMLLAEGIPFAALWAEAQHYYGLGNHFSSPVIYGLAFIFLSIHLEKKGITKSLNFAASTSLTFFSIGIFEWAYNICYAVFQGQPWVITFRWKQSSNLSFFSLFILLGVLMGLYLHLSNYRFNLGTRTKALMLLALVFWLLWIAYPFPTWGNITVATSTGQWTNSRFFPQTMYAVDLDPKDGLAIGVPYFVEDNIVHLINILAKVFTTSAILSLCCVEEKKLG